MARRWTDRPTVPAQFDLGRIRAIGEWGSASRHVGGRWEELGLDLLRQGVAGRSPLALLAVCRDPALQSALASTGSKNPDVVLAFREDETIALQPADLKWSLDVASYRQISAPVLATLLASVPALCDTIRALLPDELQDRAWLPRDGFFFCPRSLANERFISSPENRKQEYPIEPGEVLFATVDPFVFFEPLPGWLTGRELARLDGSTRGLAYLDTADRYYHLGAGVAGALAAHDRSIFEEEQEVDPATEIERFRAFAATIVPPSTGRIIERLGVAVRHRQALQRELRDLRQGAFGFRDFVAELVQAGLAAETDLEADLRRTWGEVFRGLVEAQEAELREAGRRLRSRGASDVEALEALKARREVFARQFRAAAQALLRTRGLTRGDRPEQPEEVG